MHPIPKGSKILGESIDTLLYLSELEGFSEVVVIKVLKSENPPVSLHNRLKNEYEYTKDSNITGVRKSLGLTKINGKPALLLEYVEGDTLKNLSVQRSFDLISFLRMAISVCEVLGNIHKSNIIHKDFNSNNIILNTNDYSVKVIDFENATSINLKTKHLGNPKTLEGTLQYISPEQTGRMNRTVDYRTDLYSLGISLYEALTGRLPFDTEDPLELVHFHIAKAPVSPSILNTSIPEAVSLIILKLLSKNAEDRYQSAFGVKADFEYSLYQYTKKGTINSFALATHDQSSFFNIPQKLYGREREVDRLLNAFESVIRGSKNVTMVTGPSGTGKSVLVNEIHKPVTQRKGYFVSGKYDELKKNIPYYAIINALNEFINILLTESKESLQSWKETFIDACGSNGQVLIEVLPKLEMIIGEQPSLQGLNPLEARNRFNYVFRNFIKSISSQNHPLVIFLDDLQWADNTSLDFLQSLLSDPEDFFIMFIGSYRSDEVTEDHPLHAVLEYLEANNVDINTIEIHELSIGNISQLITDTMQCDHARALPLAELIFQKTLGNAFFVNQFLISLYEKGSLKFDFDSSRKQTDGSPWSWNLETIKELNITDNVVNLVANKILTLPEDLQKCLKLASCIGNQFDFETLCIISEKDKKHLSSILFIATREGLINPITLPGSLLNSSHDEIHNHSYKFTHDKIHKAAYDLLNEDEKTQFHHEIGSLLLKRLKNQSAEDRIFEIVNHLDYSRVKDKEEKYKIAGLLLLASFKSKQAGAFKTARKYMQNCLELLDSSSWKDQYDIALEVYVELAELAYLTGNFEEMSKFMDIIIKEAQSVMDVVRVNEIMIQAYYAQGMMDKALDLAISTLSKLGVSLPKHPNKINIILGLIRLEAAFLGTGPDKLYDLPMMQDTRKLAAVRILTSVNPAAYYARPNLFPLIVFKQILLSLKYGNTEFSPFAYATYGIVLTGILNKPEKGYTFGQVATRLLSKFKSKKQLGRTTVVVNSFLRHWKIHLHDILDPIEESYRIARESGDLEYAANATFNQGYIAFFIGKNLDNLEKVVARHSQVIQGFNQNSALDFTLLLNQAIHNFKDVRNEPWKMTGPIIDEEAMIASEATNPGRINPATTFVLNFLKTYLCVYFRNKSEVIDFTDAAAKNMVAMTSSWFQPVFFFLDSLGRLSHYENVDKTKQDALMRTVIKNLKQIKHWAEIAPMNQLHRYQLIEAERNKVLKNYNSARNLYDKAIENARKNEYIQEEGLSFELTGEFYIENKQNRLGIFYLTNAYRAYKQWGAIAKLNDLEMRFPQLLVPNYQSVINRSNMMIKSVKTNGDKSSQVLDLNTVVKASQMLSSEIVLDSLLQRLLKIVMENAGAEKGFLIDNDIDSLRMLVKGQVSNNEVVSELVDRNADYQMPESILNYVARTKTSIVLNNAYKDITYGNDKYVQQFKPKSVFCYPVMRKEKLSCIIYLENNLVPGAFTTERLEVMNILASQIAISIENALLYENLEEKVRERTVEIQSKNIELEQQKEEIIAQRDMLEMVNEEITKRRDEINEKNTELEQAQEEILEKNEELVRINNNLEEIVSDRTRELKIALHKLLESNKELDTFIYRASHDLKGPISRILGLAYIGKLEKDETKGIENLSRIETTANEMDRMLAKLIKVHLIFKEDINDSSIDIHQLIDEILGSLDKRIEENGITIELDIEARTKMVSDVNLVRMILENLIENGVVFHRIKTDQERKLIIRVKDQVERVIFEVEDNGEGMDDNTRRNIYNMFFRGSNRSHGNGLGLYLVKKAVEKLDGDIENHSEPGAGTSFRVIIPDKLVSKSYGG